MPINLKQLKNLSEALSQSGIIENAILNDKTSLEKSVFKEGRYISNTSYGVPYNLRRSKDDLIFFNDKQNSSFLLGNNNSIYIGNKTGVKNFFCKIEAKDNMPYDNFYQDFGSSLDSLEIKGCNLKNKYSVVVFVPRYGSETNKVTNKFHYIDGLHFKSKNFDTTPHQIASVCCRGDTFYIVPKNGSYYWMMDTNDYSGPESNNFSKVNLSNTYQNMCIILPSYPNPFLVVKNGVNYKIINLNQENDIFNLNYNLNENKMRVIQLLYHIVITDKEKLIYFKNGSNNANSLIVSEIKFKEKFKLQEAFILYGKDKAFIYGIENGTNKFKLIEMKSLSNGLVLEEIFSIENIDYQYEVLLDNNDDIYLYKLEYTDQYSNKFFYVLGKNKDHDDIKESHFFQKNREPWTYLYFNNNMKHPYALRELITNSLINGINGLHKFPEVKKVKFNFNYSNLIINEQFPNRSNTFDFLGNFFPVIYPDLEELEIKFYLPGLTIKQLHYSGLYFFDFYFNINHRIRKLEMDFNNQNINIQPNYLEGFTLLRITNIENVIIKNLNYNITGNGNYILDNAINIDRFKNLELYNCNFTYVNEVINAKNTENLNRNIIIKNCKFDRFNLVGKIDNATIITERNNYTVRNSGSQAFNLKNSVLFNGDNALSNIPSTYVTSRVRNTF